MIKQKDNKTQQINNRSILIILFLIISCLLFVYVEKYIPYEQEMLKFQTKLEPINITQQQINLTIEIINQTTDKSKQQNQMYNNKYNISNFIENPICVFIYGYKNIINNSFMKTMDSILKQNYSNFHIVYFDDASRDGSIQNITSYFQSNKFNRYKLLENQHEKKLLHTLHSAVKYCGKQQIFVPIFSNTQLIGKHAFKLINAIFQQKKVFFVWGSSLIQYKKDNKIEYKINKDIRNYSKQIIKQTKFRKFPKIVGRFHAFLTGLFYHIQQYDFIDQYGNYFLEDIDIVYTLPILQMAAQRIYFIEELLLLERAEYEDQQQRKNQLPWKYHSITQKIIKSRVQYERLSYTFNNFQQ